MYNATSSLCRRIHMRTSLAVFQRVLYKILPNRKILHRRQKTLRRSRRQLLTLRHKEDIKAFPLANEEITFFIGLEHNKATNTWLWQTGEPVTYYVKQSTNVKDATKSCGVYVFGGYIYSHKSDGFCNFEWPYVCQRFGK